TGTPLSFWGIWREQAGDDPAAHRIELPDWWHEDVPVLDAGPGDGRLEEAPAAVAGAPGDEEDTATAPAELAPDAPIIEVIRAFIDAPNWLASRRIAEEHPELLTDEADEALQALLAIAQVLDADATKVLEEHRALLQRCREVGIRAAFAEKLKLPPGLAGLVDLTEPDLESPDALGRAVAAAMSRQDDPGAAWAQMLDLMDDDDDRIAGLKDRLRRTRALQAAIGAGSPPELARVLREHPELNEPETMRILDELIAEAQSQGESRIADHMVRFRALLALPERERLIRELEDLPPDFADVMGEGNAAHGEVDEDLENSNLGTAPAAAGTFEVGGPLGLLLEGSTLQRQGQLDKAADCFVQALAAFEQSEDARGQIMALTSIGDVAQSRGQYDLALKVYQRALQMAEAQGDAQAAAEIQASMAGAHLSRGDYDLAQELYDKALQTIKESGDRVKLANLYNNMAVLYQARRDYRRAEELLQQCLSIYEEEREEAKLSGIYGNLGALYAAQGQDHTAMEMFEKALELQQRLGLEADMGSTCNNMAVICERRNDYARALELYEKAIEIAQRLGADSSLATAYGNIGGLYAKRQDNNQAIAYYRRALEILERTGERESMAKVCANLGQVCRDCGDREQAMHYLKRAKELFAQLGDKERAARTALMLLLLERGG
ncbi:MAG TPA: tetratricopeptide repeat protein, partial [Anaerolineae bacterium]|nr:tetratricopeptide repeat protein [Anaerolineae bacterium]